jgi:hypothetical protein
VTTLRILLPDVPRADRADEWALFADDGRAVREGRDAPAAWPRAERIEAVLAAERTRIVVLTLPPMTPDRLPAAVTYALEDQLAAGGDGPRIAIGPQAADGRVTTAIAERALIEGIEAAGSFARIVPESALDGNASGWRWRSSASGQGFVATPQGAFAVTAQGGELPPELVAALAQARRAERAPASVEVAFDVDAATRARWREATGVEFVAGPRWRWTHASAADVANAPDWRAPVPAAPARERAVHAAWFRPALVIASVALALHVGATLVQWAALRWSAWRVERETIALAQSAGVADATSASAALAGLARRHADARHRAGLSAPGDALPLLAQAAPALASLPAAALRSATYSDRAWTLELGKVDQEALARLDRSLGDRGLIVMQAPTAAGVRMRITPGL